VGEIAAISWKFLTTLVASPLKSRREKRRELERRFETFLRASARMAHVYQQELTPRRPAKSAVGRTISRLAKWLSDGLFSEREQIAMTRLLQPTKVHDLERLSEDYLLAALDLANVATPSFREAVLHVTAVIEAWGTTPSEGRVDEWGRAVQHLRLEYDKAIHPRRFRRAIALLAKSRHVCPMSLIIAP